MQAYKLQKVTKKIGTVVVWYDNYFKKKNVARYDGGGGCRLV